MIKKIKVERTEQLDEYWSEYKLSDLRNILEKVIVKRGPDAQIVYLEAGEFGIDLKIRYQDWETETEFKKRKNTIEKLQLKTKTKETMKLKEFEKLAKKYGYEKIT